MERGEATIDRTIREGRRILASLDGTAHLAEPFRLAFECRGEAFDGAVRRISRFALLLCVVLGAIVAAGAVPRLIGTIVLAWLAGVLLAGLVARRRRAQHGRVLVDFETERVSAEPMRGPPFDAPLEGARLRVVAATDAIAPLWLWLVLADGRALRLAKADDPALAPIVTMFRRYGVAVERDADP